MLDRTGLTDEGDGGNEARKGEPAEGSSAGATSPGATDSPKKDFSAFLHPLSRQPVPARCADPSSYPSTSPASKIPGLLPRQSFSLLDNPSKGLKSPSAEDRASPLGGAASGAESAAAAALGGGAGAGVGVVKSLLAAPNHALGDDDDESDDDLEYTRSPFDDD